MLTKADKGLMEWSFKRNLCCLVWHSFEILPLDMLVEIKLRGCWLVDMLVPISASRMFNMVFLVVCLPQFRKQPFWFLMRHQVREWITCAELFPRSRFWRTKIKTDTSSKANYRQYTRHHFTLHNNIIPHKSLRSVR